MTNPSPSSSTSGAQDGACLAAVNDAVHKTHPKENSSALPEPLQDSDQSSHDDELPSSNTLMVMNMNQSIFGLIAAAGSRFDFSDRFCNESSSEEETGRAAEGDDESTAATNSDEEKDEDLSQTIILPPSSESTGKRRSGKARLPPKQLCKSSPSLRTSISMAKHHSSGRFARANRRALPGPPSQSNKSPVAFQTVSVDGLRQPVMSRMLEARAEAIQRPSCEIEGASCDDDGSSSERDNASPLARRLMHIFDFDQPEEVIGEYPCWLLQSVLLQGFLYVTARHICFYAHLPKKPNVVAKSGYLSKSGRRNPKYNRYWFRLKGDVLSYYTDSTSQYFPQGQIDLRFGISASISDKDKDGLHFSVVTPGHTYHFAADSPPSAKEWVKCLQRVIFRSHNAGDSVKISFPIKNVIDVEDTQMMAFANTCKIRVIDNDETYAIDEYFFSFFAFGQEATGKLKTLVENASWSDSLDGRMVSDPNLNAASQDPATRMTSDPHNSGIGLDNQPAILSLSASVKVSIHPGHSDASSMMKSGGEQDHIYVTEQRGEGIADTTQRSTQGVHSTTGKSSESLSQDDGKMHSHVQEESDSCFHSSVDEPSSSNLAVSSVEDNTASQILQDSVVFQRMNATPALSSSRPAEFKEKLYGKSVFRSAANNGIHEPHWEGQSVQPRPLGPKPTLPSISKMGSFPLQRAGALADYLNQTGKRMGTILANESMGYMEKVSGMWKGGQKHYDEPEGLRPDEDELERDSEGKIKTSMERFRAHFALPQTENLHATYFCYILRVLPLYGKIYISDRFFCFRSLLPGTRTKLILPLRDIETVDKEKGFRFGYHGLVVIVRGHEEIFFEFAQAEVRDDCAITLLQVLESMRYLKESGASLNDPDDEGRGALRGRETLLLRRDSALSNTSPMQVLNKSPSSSLNFKPKNALRITCLTIGSRGDVQPYIALCKGLMAEGHKVRIATHREFQGWIESHGIEFKLVEGDPGELMRLCIENGTFTWAFLKEANSTFRGWLDDVLESSYSACQGSDVLIESPSAMAGIHIAEKLGIPYFRAFTMPWTRTRAYPHAFIMPEHKMGGAYNYMTYVMFDNLFWRATAYQVNKWRNNTLGLPNTSLEKMQPNKVPFLYNFSPSFVATPLDFPDWIQVTGYWFLDEGDQYRPPNELEDFIRRAREDGKKIVYVGFGSIIVPDNARMTKEVIDAVLRADVRCILSKGWSERISTKEEETSVQRPDEPLMPPEIYVIKSAPHDWLFKRVDAAAHHGGSGTTGASLRAGIPTVIRPFFGDQHFFAGRVEDLGVGVHIRKWGVNSFGRALWEVTRNDRMIVKASALGRQIRMEHGVQTAIQCIYRDMEYAKSLVRRKAGKNARIHSDDNDDDDEEWEESWTFVGTDEPDPDVVTKRLSEGLPGFSASDKALRHSAPPG